MKNKIGIYSFFLSIALFTAAIFSPLKAVDTASLLPNAVQQFFDNNGKPLSSGYVYTYDVGTSTLRTTWKDSAETLVNTNPIRLDAGGKAIIYGSGTYRQVVKDRNQLQIWDAVTAPGGGGSSPTSVGDGNLVGTILPWSGLVAPSQYVFAYGQEISRANFPEYFTAVTQQLNVICSSASNVLTGLADTSQVKIGAAIELSLCVAPGTTVTGKSAATLTLSNPSSVSINATARIFPWGNGDGTTTFNVPDLRGYIPIGRDNMGGTAANRITTANCGSGISPAALGANCNANVGGGHTLIQAELPAFKPAITITDPGHFHTLGSTVVTANQNSTPGGGSLSGVSITPVTDTKTTGITAALTSNLGSGTAFSVTPPSVTINYVAKVTPDTSTSIATGVFSIGGMSGTIECGTGILCTGNIISFNSSTFAAGSTTEIQYNGGVGGFAASPNFAFISPDNLTLGAAGSTGKFDIFGSTSGRIRQTAPAIAGTTAIVWGNSSGTPAVTASSPLTISSTTGNITCTTCVVPSSVNVVTNSNLSQSGAATFKGNPTSALANVQDFTVQGLTQTVSPSALDFIPIYDNATGTFKKVNAVSIATAATAGVSSLNSLTGGLTIAAGTGIAVSSSASTITISNVGFTAATKAEQQAGTSNTVAVTPLHQQDHDSAAKAWAQFTIAGAVITVNSSYNITSIVHTGVGDYTVTFTTAFASINYACHMSAGGGTSPALYLLTGPNQQAPTTTVFRYNVASSTFGLVDPPYNSITCFGRQ